MKILLVCERLSGHGGWYTYARSLKEGLESRGHTVITCSMKGADGDHPLLPSPLDTLGKPWLLPGAAQKLKHLIDALHPDIIHVVVEPYALAAALLPHRHRKKTVLTIHGSYGIRPLLSNRSRLLACRYYKRIAGFITVSEYTKSAVTEMLGGKCRHATCGNFARSVHVVRNGIALPAWTSREKDHAMKQILLVGGVKPRKGILEALEGCAAYRQQYGKQSFLLTVVGTRDDVDHVRIVRRRIRDLALEPNARLVGSLSDEALRKAYEDADLYLMPSPTGLNTFEGYGIAFIEANAYGVPVIGPDTGGAAEAIREGRTGYRVKVSDPAMIAERMQWVLDGDRINAEECRAWAEEHDVRKRAEEVEHVYKAMSS